MALSPEAQEIYQSVTAFAVRFRLYRREGEQAVKMVPFPQSSQFMNAKEMIMKPSNIAKTLALAAVAALVSWYCAQIKS